ncbi:hypothetical protein B0H39_003210 [Clostridium beijerinckii]|uniref:Uncharacterized protein n=3 Tax=Bacillati TaxID=1783272 RepID=A0AAE5H9G4_CLOBE|nr:hypothetical protein [Clostridium beijerinckii]NOW85329.1 hypothetical protein [Clostridium beijerinckii]NSB16476.1 hypothetical protein [Clostridium beijerinckii]OOM25681.1 hypothetical protein CLOBE_34760 [Clostridium beijerinckii]
MKLLMYILKKNEKFNIDNETITFREIRDKLTEEFTELVKAIVNYSYDKTLKNLKAVVREAFDVIQVCILILRKCHTISKDLDYPDLIKEINLEHKDKLLIEKNWIAETSIEIDIKE